MKYLNKKTLFFFLAGILILIALIIFMLSTLQNSVGPSIPRPTPVPGGPIPTKSLLPSGFEQQKLSDINYAKERQRVLEGKPWLIKMPLKSSEYFIIYDIVKNEFIGSIFYDKYATGENKISQLSYAKKHALEAVKNLGVDLNKEKVILEEKGI